MAHFAKLDENNNVLWVTPLQDSICNDDEQTGIDYLTKIHNWPFWKKTSYNTFKGTHLTGGTPFRANYAGIGFVYDPDLDIFKEKNKTFQSWSMNNTTGRFEAPIPMPEITAPNIRYTWNENTQNWDQIVEPLPEETTP